MSTIKNPLITVVIPTRERCETLRYTLKTAVEQAAVHYEIIVCDNFSQDDTRRVVEEVSDPRIRYVNPGRRLSMCDNWDFALEHAKGVYVIFIGDDDAIIPGGIDRLEKLIHSHPRDAYMWTTSTYVWPIDDKEPSVEYLAPRQQMQEMNLKNLAKFVISHGGWRYYRIPGTYHAVASKEVLDKIRQRTGRVFHTTQPDLFTSMAIPVFAKSCLNIGDAITIQGRSAKSNGGASIAKDGAAVQARFISEYGSYKLHPTLFQAAPTVANYILDAILVAMDTFPEFYRGMKFNYDAMWAFMCRLGLISRWQVIRQRRAINRYHKFSMYGFIISLVIHDVSALRRRILDGILKAQSATGVVPRNILAFANGFAMTERAAAVSTDKNGDNGISGN